MTPLKMIQEWRRGCSCASKERPEECQPCTRGLIDSLEPALKRQQDALTRAARLFEEALPKFNWSKSALDANAIQLLNEVPREVRAALQEEVNPAEVLREVAQRIADQSPGLSVDHAAFDAAGELLRAQAEVQDLTMNRTYLEEACETVDAAVFSGDVLYDDRDREALKGYVARWARAIEEHENLGGPDFEDGCSLYGFVGGCERMGCKHGCKHELGLSPEDSRALEASLALDASYAEAEREDARRASGDPGEERETDDPRANGWVDSRGRP